MPVISIENLSKTYHLGQIGTGTFSRDLEVWWAKLRGKPNPLLKIGQHDHGNRDGEELWALRAISFTVEQGEVLGIIGRNGAGKSTLLKILSRVTAPTSGKIKVKGRIASLLEVGTGFHPDLTGRENIYLNGSILGMSRKEIERKFDEIVDFAEVEKFIDTPVKRYSSGMYVRLAFAVAAHLEPEILVVDEVLAVGDAEFQKKCLGKMSEVAGRGRTVLFVSHNLGSIRQICSRGILINNGRLTLDSSVSEVIQEYLQKGHSQLGERLWGDIETAPGDDVVRLSAARVLNETSEICTTFDVRDSVLLEAEYRVLQEIPLDAYFFLYNEMGVCVFVSLDNNDSPWRNSVRPIGLYRETCRIPSDFLNVGQFSVYCGIARNLDKARLHLYERDVLFFSVGDSEDEDGVRGNFKRNWPTYATVRPRMQWDVSRIDLKR